MTENSTKQTVKEPFTTQTVRVPKRLQKLIKHRIVETDESFQTYVIRLILDDVAAAMPNIDTSVIPEINQDRRKVNATGPVITSSVKSKNGEQGPSNQTAEQYGEAVLAKTNRALKATPGTTSGGRGKGRTGT